MGVLGGVAAVIAFAIAPAAAPAAGTLKGDYQLEGNRSSSCGSPPSLVDVGAGSNAFTTEFVDGGPNGVLTFPAGNGLRLNTAGLIPQNRYTVIMQFRVADLNGGGNGYVRLLAFDGPDPPVSDSGFYVTSGSLDFYVKPTDHLETIPTVVANQFVNVAITRDAAGLVSVYNNGALRISYDDSASNIGLLAGNSIEFFKDNLGEETNGAVARIRVYDDALSAAEVLAPPACQQFCAGRLATISGTPGNDRLRGTAKRDVIAALGGNDKVSGLAGNDLICGGAGRDTLKGGPGRDTLRGEAGRDVLKGGPRKDRLIGGPGKDKQVQ
jgi:Ca2+-binding RTX toxin-like protein